jgi:carbamoyltransferase
MSSEPLFLLQAPSSHRLVIRYDSEIGHRYVPDINARIPNELGGFYVRTNADGFRSDIPFVQKRGDSPRIVFLGDSVTAGDGVSNHERFSDLVGKNLGSEVYNYGLSGSGTDQQLLIYERYAREVEADLVVLCVYIENIERIKASHRETILGSSGDRVMVPKPYFQLDGNGELDLHHVPVPLERPVASGDRGVTRGATSGFPQRVLWRVRQIEGLNRMRWLGTRFGDLRNRALRLVDYQPYPDYLDPDSQGWQLMQAIVERLVEAARPTPVLIVPLPSEAFHRSVPLRPRFQERFESLTDVDNGVHVMDLSTPLANLPEEARNRLDFDQDWHPSPFGHEVMADHIAAAIRDRELLPAAPCGPSSVVVRDQRGRAEPESAKPVHILGISGFYHDSAAALVTDGQIVAAVQEERFSRIKNDRSFPLRAINYCLEEAGIQQDDLSAVVYYDNAYQTFERLMHTQVSLGETGEDTWLRVLPSWLEYKLHVPEVIRRNMHYDGIVLHNQHHRSHAASAFLPSPFDEAAILTVDGVGEWATASIGIGHGKHVELLEEQQFPNSLGLLYSAFTQFTGFKVNEGEYKLMGLAPYGEPLFADLIREHLVTIGDDGSIDLDLDYFAFLENPTMYNGRFEALFGGPGRRPDEPIRKRDMDIARSIQVVTEEAVMQMAAHARAVTGKDKLCMAGGVALNCVANGRILREGPFSEIWIQPAAGDAGGALGAALDVWCNHFDGDRIMGADGGALQGNSCWGPEYSEVEVAAFLDTYGLPYEVLGGDQRSTRLAQLLEDGMVLGHFSGRMEYGPRALGARSIVGDARDPETQTKLNLKIKQRESFRPFAPAVLSDMSKEYFDLDCESPYMLIVAPVLDECRLPFESDPDEPILDVVKRPRSSIPAVTHVDYTARVQTVTREYHAELHGLIEEFRARTGCGLVVNTSFNVNGEPIVCTPEDAYRCFMSTDMDALVLGNVLLQKADQPVKSHLPDRGTKVSPAVGTSYSAELLEAMKVVYSETYLPAARLLPAAVKQWDHGGDATMWRNHPSSADGAFEIPAALLDDTGHPDEIARAVLSQWQPGPVTDAMESVVIELMTLRRDHLPFPEAGGEVAATVPGSAYVMY